MDAEVTGEVFAECKGKRGFPGFGFLGTGRNYPFLGQPGRWARKTAPERARREANGCILNGDREPKWKFR